MTAEPQVDNGSWQQQPYTAGPPPYPDGIYQEAAYTAAPQGYEQPYLQQAPTAAPAAYQQQEYHGHQAQQAYPGYTAGQPAAPPPAAAQNPYGFPASTPAQPYYGTPSGFPIAQGAPVGTPMGVKAPGIGMIIAITAIFGLFGFIPTNRRAKQAEALGLSTGRYWKAFVFTFAVAVAFFGIIGALTEPDDSTADSTATSTITAEWLEQSILNEADFTDRSGTTSTPTSVTCAPLNVNEDGAGTWRCMVDFGATGRQGFDVAVGADGRWVTRP